MYRRIAALIRDDATRRFLVVSAISSVTDSLLAAVSKPRAEKEIDSFVAEMRRVHLRLLSKGEPAGDVAVEAIEALCTKLSRLLYGISYTEEITPRVQDFALSFGERLAAQVVAANLRTDGVDAVSFEADQIGLMTDENYGNASALLEETKVHMAPLQRRRRGVCARTASHRDLEGHRRLHERGPEDCPGGVPPRRPVVRRGRGAF